MTCAHCGDERFFEVFECWADDRSFMLDACCETYHDALQADLAHAMTLPPRERVRFLAPLREAFTDAGLDFRTVFDDGCEGARVDFGLSIVEVSLSEAKTFVSMHHAHNRPPVSWRWGYGLMNGPELIGVAMVGRPVARMIDADRVVEVSRLCLRRDVADLVRWNGSSMLYAAAARDAKARGFEKVQTYTLETESGASLKASGWEPEWLTRGGSWNRPSRDRQDTAPTCRKVRWSRYLTSSADDLRPPERARQEARRLVS